MEKLTPSRRTRTEAPKKESLTRAEYTKFLSDHIGQIIESAKKDPLGITFNLVGEVGTEKQILEVKKGDEVILFTDQEWLINQILIDFEKPTV